MSIFAEISWLQFQQLHEIRHLPLTEQMRQYNQYLYELNEARMSWIAYQNKGPRRGFLQQENLFYILQEDGSNIIIT